MQKGEQQVCERARRIPFLGILLCSGLLVSGCVVLEEKYNAEKARSLNFQRLLAQEEKRTAELDSEIRHTKAELAEFEARNRELSAQVQVAREQMGRLQEEAEAIREATVLERKALEDMQRKGPSVSAKPKKVEAAESCFRRSQRRQSFRQGYDSFDRAGFCCEGNSGDGACGEARGDPLQHQQAVWNRGRKIEETE